MKRLPFLALTAAIAASVVVWHDRPSKEPATEPEFADPFPETFLMLPFAQERLARDVIEGRRPLLEAATLFSELNRLKGDPSDCVRIPAAESPLNLPGRTAAERLCQHVEKWVRAILRNDPDRKVLALAHLDAEFQAAMREHGEIILPDPASLEPVEQLVRRIRETLTPIQRHKPCPR